jgi:hypothetical protein
VTSTLLKIGMRVILRLCGHLWYVFRCPTKDVQTMNARSAFLFAAEGHGVRVVKSGAADSMLPYQTCQVGGADPEDGQQLPPATLLFNADQGSCRLERR